MIFKFPQTFLLSCFLVLFLLLGGGQKVSADSLSSSSSVSSSISYWCSYYGVSCSWAFSIVSCESELDPSAYNSWSGASGLWQFMPSTYSWYRSLMNSDSSDHSGMEYGSLWSAWSSSHVALYMISLGYSYKWSCA